MQVKSFEGTAGLVTVNVIVTDENGAVTHLHSFPDTKKGNAKAEEWFIHYMRSCIWNFHEYTQEDIDACLEQGYENWGKNSIKIVHSTGNE